MMADKVISSTKNNMAVCRRYKVMVTIINVMEGRVKTKEASNRSSSELMVSLVVRSRVAALRMMYLNLQQHQSKSSPVYSVVCCNT